MNISGINTAAYSNSLQSLNSNTKRISGGIKLITDDPAGAGISSRMFSLLSASEMAGRNISNAISMTQTSASWLDQVNSNLNRMKELSIQANSGMLSASDKKNIDAEFNALQENIIDITSKSTASAQFNGTYLLRGGNGQAGEGGTIEAGNLNVQTGPEQGQTQTLDLPNLDVENNKEIGTVTTYDYNEQNQVTATNQTSVKWNDILAGVTPEDPGTIGKLDKAIDHVSKLMANNASDQVILEEQYDALLESEANIMDGASKIRDVDIASETTLYASNMVKSNVAMAIQVQAQQLASSSILSLLQR